MKKFLAILFVVIMAVSLIACSGNDEPTKESDSVETPTAVETTEATEAIEATEATEAATEPVAIERDLPEGDYAELGEGTVYVATPSGTSEDGNIPVIYADSDTIMTQIGLDAWEFNGGALSFIYIDGVLVGKEQLADTQTTLTLSGEQLAVGIHTVEVVQYENDEPGAEMTTYKSMQYEIKGK